MLPLLGGLLAAGGSIAGAGISAGSAADAGARNAELQRQFAQLGLRWRAADASQAEDMWGINKLTMLGAPSIGASPSYVGGGDGGMSAVGQNLGRAIAATQSNRERSEEFQDLQIKHAGLQNEHLEAQLKMSKYRLAREQAMNPIPTDTDGNIVAGQGDAYVNLRPAERYLSYPRESFAKAGTTPDVGYLDVKGGVVPAPSPRTAEMIQDNVFQQGAHFYRNNLKPIWSDENKPSFHRLRLYNRKHGTSFNDWKWTGDRWRAVYNEKKQRNIEMFLKGYGRYKGRGVK